VNQTRTTAIILVSFLLWSLATTAWSNSAKNMSVSIDPIDLLAGSIPLTFRVKLANRFSLGLSGYDKIFNTGTTPVLGVGGGLSAKFHLSAPAFTDGWYVKPEVMAGYWVVGESPEKSVGLALEPRLMSGYEWIWPSGLSVSLGLGIKFMHFTGNQTAIQKLPGFGFHGFFPNADLSLGWAF
jgi:hypothetical protein